MANLKNLVKHILETGGITYNINKEGLTTTGFICAKAENECIISGKLEVTHLQDYITKYSEDLKEGNANLGAWFNAEDGKTYLDTSYRFDTLEEAVAFGKANNQLAIFDLNTFKEIRL